MEPALCRGKNVSMELNKYARFEGIKVVTVKITLFWDATPCSQIEVHRRFGRNVLLLSSPVKEQAKQEKSGNLSDVEIEAACSS
jgi:hypothetical protein